MTAINLATGAQEVFNAACSDRAAHLQALGGGVAPTCATRQNAIWSRPGVDLRRGYRPHFHGHGQRFNGTLGQFDGNHNWSESVIALHPDGSGGNGGQRWQTARQLHAYRSRFARQRGSPTSAAPHRRFFRCRRLPAVQHLAVQGGKDPTLRLLNLQNLSGQGGPGTRRRRSRDRSSTAPQGGCVLSQPAVWVNSADGSSTWIFVVNGSGASGLRLNFDGSGNPSLSTQWQNGLSGTSPVVANSMVFFVGSSSIHALIPSGTPLWSAARNGSTHWQS